MDLLSEAAQPLASIPDNMNWARARAEAVQARAMLGDIEDAGSDLEATERFVQVHDVRGFYRSELTIARARLALVMDADTDGPPSTPPPRLSPPARRPLPTGRAGSRRTGWPPISPHGVTNRRWCARS